MTHKSVAAVAVVSAFHIFRDLTTREIEKIIPLVSQKRFNAGELVFAEGDRSNEIFLVGEGVFDSNVRSEDGEVAVASFATGDIFGEMAFFDQHPRSAACQARESGQVLIIDRQAFITFQRSYPATCSKILKNIYGIIADRLQNSNSFLSEMVRWGEGARKRAITDGLTGLFNRRYFDDLLDRTIFDARVNDSHFVIAMMDIDNFGILNRDFGNALADECVKIFAQAGKRVFGGAANAVARYGGDEFVVLLPRTTVEDATALCDALRTELTDQITRSNSEMRSIALTVSQGIAHFPDHATNKEDIFAAADAALYRAKDQGRNRAVVFDVRAPHPKADSKSHFEQVPLDIEKSDIPSIAQRNRIINNITNAILHRNSCIIVGHVDCDEDCFSSAVACALLLKKFKKEVAICMQPPSGSKFALLQTICAYNDILILSPAAADIPQCDTIIICDTPKPGLLDSGPKLNECIHDPSILKIEFDHHLGGDSKYSGSRHYCMVQQASSTCEIVLLLCLKLRQQREALNLLHVKQVLTRNISLALAVGILSDTQNGEFLHTEHDRRAFRGAIGMLDRYIMASTFGNKKVMGIADVMHMNDQKSPLELRLEKYFTRRIRRKPHLHFVVLNWTESIYLARTYDRRLIQDIARIIANQLAEASEFFGLVGYTTPGEPPITQFRIRRSAAYRDMDLRILLKQCDFQDGGGHEGAVGFRFSYTTDKDIDFNLSRIIETVRNHFKGSKHKKIAHH